MNYASLVAKTESNKQDNVYNRIASDSKPLVNIVNGIMRWLEDAQEIQFDNPIFRGNNAEFSIINKPYQKIWFSQISSIGISEDFNTPLSDEIIFKGHPQCYIFEKFKSANEFWNAVKGKKFKVTIKGKGFCLNQGSDVVKSLKAKNALGRGISVENIEKSIFDYIRQSVKNGDVSHVSGTLKNKTAYRLTEI